MAKYDYGECGNAETRERNDTLTDIANELAEANRLKRIELTMINCSHDTAQYLNDHEELEDKA